MIMCADALKSPERSYISDYALVWPSEHFWSDANLLLQTTRNLDVIKFINQIRTSYLDDLLGIEGLRTVEQVLRRRWNAGWQTIQTFVAEHSISDPRGIVTIAISYICVLICSMVSLGNNDEKFESVRDALVGTCLGMVYTDSYIDNPCIDPGERLRYIEFLNRRFDDSSHVPYNDATRAAVAAYEMVEKHSVSTDDVRHRLRVIMQTHHEMSILSTTEDYRNQAFKLGSQTGHLFASVLGVSETDEAFDAIGSIGAWMQLLDDAADVDDDINAEISTYASCVLQRDGNMDRYWTELRAIAEKTAVITHKCVSETIDQNAASTIAFLMLVLTGMSYAKMSVRLTTVDDRFGDASSANKFYTTWRAAYEATVQDTIRKCNVYDNTIGRLVWSVMLVRKKIGSLNRINVV